MIQGLFVNRRFLVRFQYGCEKDLTSNKLTATTVDKRPVNEESEVTTTSSIPYEIVDL